MIKPVIFISYFLNTFIYLILMNQPAFWPGFISKALIMPLLIILFLISINPLHNRLHIFLFAGLLFSWAGDVVLEFSKNNSNIFIIGLVCFLLAHIMYFIVFIKTPGRNYIFPRHIWLLLPVIIYGIGLVSFLYRDLAEMRVPVIIYATLILAMLTGAINRKNKVNSNSYYLVLAGAILFVMSDSTIAINKFSYQFELSGILIMISYILAQYLIVTGYIYQFAKDKTDQISR